MNIESIRPRHDNLICRFDWLSQSETVTTGGIIIPNLDKPDASTPVRGNDRRRGP